MVSCHYITNNTTIFLKRSYVNDFSPIHLFIHNTIERRYYNPSSIDWKIIWVNTFLTCKNYANPVIYHVNKNDIRKAILNLKK